MEEAANYAIKIIIHKLIIPRMKAIGMNQTRLAKSSGISQSQISDFLSGSSDITLTKFVKILTALEINAFFAAKGDDPFDYKENTIHFN